MQQKEVLVVGGRLLGPRNPYDSNDKDNKNKDLAMSLTIDKWQLEVDLDKRVVRIKGPNRAIYPLMEGTILLCMEKETNGVESYFTKFYDTKVLEFFKKYGIDDVIVEDPNHSFDFRGNATICTDGKVISETSFGEQSIRVKGASYVLEYWEENEDGSALAKGTSALAQYANSFRKSNSTFLKNKQKGLKCLLHTQDGVVTLGMTFENGGARRD